mgnify:CR=1 FL=1
MNEDYVYETKREEYDIYLIKDNIRTKLNIGHCYTLQALIVDWFDKIDDQFSDYPFYSELDEETIVRMYFIFYGHGLYEITKNNNLIYSKNI